MKRRDFIAALGGAAALAPLTASAQQAMPVIGFMSAMLSSEAASPRVIAFRDGLAQAGYAEGRNVAINYYHEGGSMDRMPGIATEMVRRKASAIFALGTVPALAAKAATTTIPIVFATGDDPVTRGLVATLNRPGGNITGVTFVSAALAAKRLQLLRSLAPNAELIGVLADTQSPESQTQSRGAQEAARALKQQLVVFDAATDSEIDAAFATLVQRRVGALLIAGGPFLASRGSRVNTLATRHAIPTMYPFRDFAPAGGLISYGASFADSLRQAGIYVGRILRGEKPADLPVVQPTKFDLVINLGTAKALGIDLPPMLLALADQVIE